jgi:hypothetical protein
MRLGRRSSRIRRSRESGYALLMVIFMVATMLLVAAMATPNVLTQGRREREQETIWRGNQYARGIQLYYRKNGRYPQTMEDLTKGTLDVHFLRKAYTDPMNTSDGSWRFIYVAPSGQLIGSVRYHSLQEMALALGMPGAGQPLANPAASAVQAAGQGAAQQGATAPTGVPGQPSAPAQGPFAPTPPATSGFGQPAPAAPLSAVDGPVLGASLIGVASKVKQSSLIVYQGGKTYFEWEFIWNPLSVISVTPPTGAAPAGPPGPGQNGAPVTPASPPQGPASDFPPLTNPTSP